MAASLPHKSRGKNVPKVPVVVRTPVSQKLPRYLGSFNIENQHMAWRFSNADINGPFTCAQLTHEEHKSLWERLTAFERKNVAELRDFGSYHTIQTRNISSAAKQRLRVLGLDDQEVLHSFHIAGSCRLWCMKHQNLFSVLWWDRDHQVYLVPKKHT